MFLFAAHPEIKIMNRFTISIKRMLVFNFNAYFLMRRFYNISNTLIRKLIKRVFIVFRRKIWI